MVNLLEKDQTLLQARLSNLYHLHPQKHACKLID